MLTVDSNPYAVIKIDGTPIGTTPLFRVALPPGKHKLHAIDPAGREQFRTITIDEGEEQRVQLDWSSS